MGFYKNDATAANNTALNGINAQGGASPQNIDNLIRELAAQGKQFALDIGGATTVGGTADAITISANDTVADAYFDGMVIGFVAGSDNATTTPTANVNSIGAEPIKKALSTSGSETALAAGDIQSGGLYLLRWRSAWDSGGGAWQLIDLQHSLLHREVLSGNRTYYVRSDGSDSNDGLTNTSGGAFLTILKAWQVATSLDFGGYTVTIKCTGTFSAGVGTTALSWVGGGGLIFEGDTANPANAVIAGSANLFQFDSSLPGPVFIRGFKLSNSSNAASTVRLNASGLVYFGSNEWAGQPGSGFAGVLTAAAPGAHIVENAANVISGGGNGYLVANAGGYIQIFAVTHTVTGTPNWSWQFAYCGSNSEINGVGATYSGAATGKRYTVDAGVIRVGGSSTFFPGSTAGSTANGGIYI